MTKERRILGLAVGVVVVGAAAAVECSAPRPNSAVMPLPTPTALPLSRTNPNIVEEDDVHIVERFPKDRYIRIDDRHFRHLLIPTPIMFFKEDEKYFYVYTYKRNAETEAVDKALRALTPSPTAPAPAATPTPSGSLVSDFEDISPVREPGRIRLQEVPANGLPTGGLWRASFVVADINGDGIPDIVSPPARLGDARLHVWIGDGKGHFSAWPLRFIEDGKADPAFSIDYGAVAVGDIDGDGHLDIVSASHGGGLVALFGDGTGTFRIVKSGLPTRDFSSQAVALADVDGDGRLDIIASADTGGGEDTHQVRVYLYRGSKGWEYKEDAIVALYSNSLFAWDFHRDGRLGILTGSHFISPKTLLWKAVGNARFEMVDFPALEPFAYHFASVPGTFGKEQAPSFADAYYTITTEPEMSRVMGITVYVLEKGVWARHRVWRKKNGRSAQYALAVGDLDGDGLDDVVFADSEVNRLRMFFQKPDGTYVEAAESEEPVLDSPGQCIRLADLDGDGRFDIVLSKTVASYRPEDKGGWSVYLNRR